MEIIVGKKGDQKVSITDQRVSKKHCKLTEQADGTFILEDLGSLNGTFVNGVSVIKTHVTRDTIIQLGPELKLKVADLVGKPQVVPHAGGHQGPQTPLEPPTYSISRLQQVWDEYQNTLDEIRDKQKSINTWRMATPIFTMLSGVLTAVTGGSSFGWILLTIGLCITIYAFIRTNKDDSDERRKEALEKFQSNYYCPNPECGKALGPSPKILLQNKTCPYCHCKFKP